MYRATLITVTIPSRISECANNETGKRKLLHHYDVTVAVIKRATRYGVRHLTMSDSKENSVKVGLKDGRMHSVSDDRARGGRCSIRAELLILCAVTVLIWLLLLLPIIIYSQIPVVSIQNAR
jgi:hypothetical protein